MANSLSRIALEPLQPVLRMFRPKPEPISLSLLAFDLCHEGRKARAEEGDAESQFKLANYYMQNAPTQNYALALIWYNKAAAQQHTGAQMALGQIYAQGVCVDADDQTALNWYMKAADNGDAQAQFTLGTVFEVGRLGRERDFEQARKWYLMAATEGHAGAKYRLALLYLHGHGVKSNQVTAQVWFELAARAGYKAAASGRDRLAQNLNLAQKQKVASLVGRWQGA